MKKTQVFLILIFCIACSNPHSKTNESLITKSKGTSNVKYIHLNKLSVTGDFDGDGNIDTLIENNISRLNNLPIDSIPDYVEWDSTARFFDKLNSDVILTLLNKKSDTIHFGSIARGLYCLVNIGDNNNDNKDEIAFVVDLNDFSNINSCRIMTLCKNKWVELKSFTIHEDAFEEDNSHLFKGIKGFLEYRKNKWMYIDYYKLWSAQNDTDTILKPLKTKRNC